MYSRIHVNEIVTSWQNGNKQPTRKWLNRNVFIEWMMKIKQSYRKVEYMLLQNVPLQCIILSYDHLKNSKCSERLSLNSSICLKTYPPNRNLTAINLFPGSFINQGRSTHHWRLEVNTTSKQTLSQTIIPPSTLRRVHFSPLKIISSLLRGLQSTSFSLSLLRWYLNLNSKPFTKTVTHFSLGISHIYLKYIC